MRLLRLTFFSLVFLLLLGSVSHGQIIDCSAIGESPNDTLRVISQFAAPGDTLLVPLALKNPAGVATFQFYLEFDSTFLHPIVTDVDSLRDSLGNFLGQTQNIYEHAVTGRLLYTETIFVDGFPVLDTTTNVQVVDEIDFSTGNQYQRVKIIGAFEDLFNPEEIIAPGEGTIMYMKFVVDSNQVQDATSLVDFYTETIETRDTAFPYDVVRTDCLYSRTGDVSGTNDIRLTTLTGLVKIDTAHTAGTLPVVNSFTANPTSITSGSSSTLSWSVSDATEITINNGVGTFTALTGNTTVSPTATTTYTLTAINSNGSASGVTTVTVGGGGTTNNNPVVQSVTGAPFTVNQGETVSFSVTATDADATDIITLSAVSIPAGSIFNQAVGSQSVSGNFSWTPDFSTSPGTYVASFRATDDNGGTSATVNVGITVNEIVNHVLFSTSSEGQSPVGGLRGKKSVLFPINLVTAQEVYGVQFDFVYDPIYFEVDSFIVTGRTVDYVIYDDIGANPGIVRVATLGLNNEPVATVADTSAILYAVMTIDSGAAPGDYPITFENAWESVSPDPNIPGMELVVNDAIIQVDSPGDVNLDKHINVADLVNVVASIISNYTLSERQADASDVVLDNVIDVFDLVGIVNMIFGLPVSQAPALEDETATMQLAFNDIQAGGNEMMVVNSEIPTEIAAVELEIEYNPSLVSLGRPTAGYEASSLDIHYSDDKSGKMKILMNFTNPLNASNLIARGEAEMLNIPVSAIEDIEASDTTALRIKKALLSTSVSSRVIVEGIDNPGIPDHFELSQNYPNPFNPTTTIKFSLAASERVRLDVFNILGQHVTTLVEGNLPAGEHLIEWDATDGTGRSIATGIYLYRLSTDRQTQTKKMLFLK